MNALLQQAASNTADQSKGTDGPSFEVAPAGLTTARFIGYVETGNHPQEFEGKPKAPAREATLFFELNGKNHRREVEKDGVMQTFTNRASVTLTVSTNTKSGFYKLFQAMRNERENIKNMAQMLGEAFLVTVVHGKSKDGKKTYVNLRNETGWTIKPAVYAPDPLDVAKLLPLPVPEATQPYMLLLWDMPTKEQWDSIFIDGVRKVKRGDEEVEVSKNWLQETCMAAVNFSGSPLEAMLMGMGDMWKELKAKVDAHGAGKSEDAPEPEAPADPLAGAAQQQVEQKAADPQPKADPTPAPAPAPAATTPATTQPTAKPPQDADAILAALGMAV